MLARKEASVSKKEAKAKGNGKDQIKEAVIYYQVPLDHRILPVNGCYGGLGPRGELIINFFEETFPLPKTVTHEVIADGTLGKQKTVEIEGGNLVRHVQASIAVSIEHAESIGKWMLKNVEDFKKQRGIKK